jgi:hypothetical protein
MTDGRKDAKTAAAVLSSCQLGIPVIVTTFHAPCASSSTR